MSEEQTTPDVRVAAPPRQAFPPGASWLGLSAVVIALLLASFFSVLPRSRTQDVSKTTPQVGTNGPAGVGASAPAAAGGQGAQAGASGPGAAASQQLACAAGRNGGKTDTGVSGGLIKLASKVVESGIGERFLGEVGLGMIAGANQGNSAGGVCGRQLGPAHRVVGDGWGGPPGLPG